MMESEQNGSLQGFWHLNIIINLRISFEFQPAESRELSWNYQKQSVRMVDSAHFSSSIEEGLLFGTPE